MVAGRRFQLDLSLVKYRRREPPFLRLWSLCPAMDCAYLSAVNEMRRSLIKPREGDVIRFQSPVGVREIEIVEVSYEVIS